MRNLLGLALLQVNRNCYVGVAGKTGVSEMGAKEFGLRYAPKERSRISPNPKLGDPTFRRLWQVCRVSEGMGVAHQWPSGGYGDYDSDALS